jgi:hypothetical protein
MMTEPPKIRSRRLIPAQEKSKRQAERDRADREQRMEATLHRIREYCRRLGNGGSGYSVSRTSRYVMMLCDEALRK